VYIKVETYPLIYNWSSAVLKERIIFIICCIIIVLVSAIDIYWLVRNSEYILEYEKNPIGTWLIHQDNGSVALFTSLKVIGTFIVITTLSMLYYLHAIKTIIMASILALLQLILLCVLLW
jgi:hypothetical protein